MIVVVSMIMNTSTTAKYMFDEAPGASGATENKIMHSRAQIQSKHENGANISWTNFIHIGVFFFSESLLSPNSLFFASASCSLIPSTNDVCSLCISIHINTLMLVGSNRFYARPYFCIPRPQLTPSRVHLS